MANPFLQGPPPTWSSSPTDTQKQNYESEFLFFVFFCFFGLPSREPVSWNPLRLVGWVTTHPLYHLSPKKKNQMRGNNYYSKFMKKKKENIASVKKGKKKEGVIIILLIIIVIIIITIIIISNYHLKADHLRFDFTRYKSSYMVTIQREKF